jgi:hypothetical protein
MVPLHARHYRDVLSEPTAAFGRKVFQIFILSGPSSALLNKRIKGSRIYKVIRPRRRPWRTASARLTTFSFR